MAIWLKLVGATDAPMPPRWLDGRKDLNDEVGFNKKASVDIGEDLVLYAVPQGKIIGIAEVLSHPIKGRKDGEERWPWRSKIRLKLAVADYDRCPGLEEIQDPGGRELKVSVRRQSHIGLSWSEYERARAALEARFDASLGDLRG